MFVRLAVVMGLLAFVTSTISACSGTADPSPEPSASSDELLTLSNCPTNVAADVPVNCGRNWNPVGRDRDAGPCPPEPTNADGTKCTQVMLGRSDCFKQYIGCPGYVALNLPDAGQPGGWTKEANREFISCAAAGRLGATCDVPIAVCSPTSDIPDPARDGSAPVTTDEMCQLRASGCNVLLGSSPGSVTDCPGFAPPNRAAACDAAGDYMDRFRGTLLYGSWHDTTAAYCNDGAQADRYQCDEFANRFVSSLELPPLDDYVNDYACQICDIVEGSPYLSQYYSVFGPGYRSTAGNKPVTGDLLVFQQGGCAHPGPPGHVAVVTGADKSNIYYIQQNWIISGSVGGSAYAAVPRSAASWNESTSFFGNAGGPGGGGYQPKCWVHPVCPPGAACNPGLRANPCLNASNGLYCGDSSAPGFGAGDANTVYECFDNKVANARHCLSGCLHEEPFGNDSCADPCYFVTPPNNGAYCGRSTQAFFNANGAADSNTVYSCEQGVTQSSVHCPTGCTVEPIPGVDDHCNADPCANVAASNNGVFCGLSNENRFATSAALPSALYDCEYGHTVSMIDCANGCNIAPAHHNDSCR